MPRRRPVAAAVLGALCLSWAPLIAGCGPQGGELEVVTEPVERRDIERVVASTGAIAPLVSVEVGSQLSGQVEAVIADFNDAVSAGDVLARLDPQTFQSRVRELEAGVEVARAQRAVAEAGVERAQADLIAAQNAFSRARRLLERGNTSQAQFDDAQAALAGARAGSRAAFLPARRRASLERG